MRDLKELSLPVPLVLFLNAFLFAFLHVIYHNPILLPLTFILGI